jgi:hypothetical protein
MLRTKLVHFAGRMQWVPKGDEALNIGAGCTNLRSDSSTHRLAASHQRATADFFLASCLQNSPETRFELVVRIRNTPALLGVQKIETPGAMGRS